MLKTLFIFPVLIRLIRWLAIVQQKEYRLDRMWIFMNSPEGKKELLKFVIGKKDLTRTGLKRPVRTKRVIFTGILSIILLIIFFILFMYLLSALTGSSFYILDMNGLNGLNGLFLPSYKHSAEVAFVFTIYFIISCVFVYIFIPAIVMLAIFPTTIFKISATYYQLTRAKKKLSKKNPFIIGITGSYGKTTTKLLLTHVLSEKFSVFTTPKSFNNRYSIPRSINQKYEDQEIVVLEYAAYTKGEIKFLTQWFKPQMAVITGLTPQHLGLFGTMENIITAKAELIKALPNDAYTFCNARDKGALDICAEGGLSVFSHDSNSNEIDSKKKLVRFSGEESMAQVTKHGFNDSGELFFTWKGEKIQTSLIGAHYMDAIGAAITVAENMGMSSEEIRKALTSFEQPSAFITLTRGKQNKLLINDGKTTNPKGFEAALELLSWYKQRGMRSVLITKGIVDLANLSHEVHKNLAMKSIQIVDDVIYLGVDGLEEFTDQFGDRLMKDQDKVIDFVNSLSENDVILIEGKIPKWLENII